MPKHQVPSTWGLCFDGNEKAFCEALDVAIANASGPFRYAEIGLGYGGGMNAVGHYLAKFEGLNYRRVGVDIPEFERGNAGKVGYYDDPSTLELRLVGAAQFFKDAAAAVERYDFIFIDGCHGAPCVTNDFLGAERVIRPGGVVAFHDTDPGCQDLHLQPHCKTGIRAREAVEKLGLLDDKRPGWRKLWETSGNKDKGGHGCLFVQRLPA